MASVPAANAQQGSPINDDFANAIILSGATNHISISLAGATSEPAEAQPICGAFGKTAWWTYTAPADGQLFLTFTTNFPASVASIYEGSDLTNLRTIATNMFVSSGFGCLPRQNLAADVRGGVIYHIALDGLSDADVDIVFYGRPPNDNFAQREKLSGSSLVKHVDTRGSTFEPGEPSIRGVTNNTVWYEWTAPISGTVAINDYQLPVYPTIPWTGGGGDGGVVIGHLLPVANGYLDPSQPLFSPWIGVFQGTNLNDLALWTSGIPVFFWANAGDTFSFAVTSANAARGEFDMYLRVIPPPANDLFENRTVLTGDSIYIAAHNIGATPETFWSPLPAPAVTRKSVWWSWTPDADGTVSIKCTADYDIPMPFEIYTGDTVGALKKIAVGDNDGLAMNVTGGQAYQIGAYGRGQFDETEGPLNLQIHCLHPALNAIVTFGSSSDSSVFEFNLNGGVGQKYRIESSPDLHYWFTAANGTFTNSATAKVWGLYPWEPIKFFRLVPAP
jgi:hypothetical protein